MKNQDEEFPRVLVISHNSFSDTQNNGKTLSAFFKGWPKDRLAQLYLWPEEPDLTVCEQYYRITDYEILAGFLRGHHKAGGEHVVKNENNELNAQSNLGRFVGSLYKKRGNHDGGQGLHSVIYELFKRRVPVALIGRDILWNLDYWKTDDLNEWLNKFAPDLVFYQSSNGVFAFRLVNWISHTLSIPIIMEVTDDYVSPKRTIDIFWWGHYFWLKRWFTMTVKKACKVIAIGDLMAEEYRHRFGGEYDVLMNSVSIDKIDSSCYAHRDNGAVKFIYAGSLHLNRWKTISVIGQCLKELSAEGYNTQFDIFTNVQPSSTEQKAITIPPVMRYGGSLNQEELKNTLNKSDILVHVEAFDRKSRATTRLSVSTKIPEYMITGRCIFAVGPKEVASIQYLQQNNIAEVCTSIDKKIIKDKLRSIIMDTDKRLAFSKRAQLLAIERHDAKKTQITIKNHIIGATSKIDSCCL